jgi:HD-GYP domain-containing protein (c-di-GMP phosphodiesterase class II)
MYENYPKNQSADTIRENAVFTARSSAGMAFQAIFDRTNRLARGADYQAMLGMLNHFLVMRDAETEGHSEQVARLAVEFATWLKRPESEIEIVRRGAWMHDLGKLGIPDYILQKRGPLTEPEWVIMRRHPEYAYRLLSAIPYFKKALAIPYCHHERWDGTGYPRGLKGEQIPYVARLFSLIDVWDALLSVRAYKQAWPPFEACAFIKAQAGKMFDPRLTQAFVDMLELRVREGRLVL